MHKGKPYKVNKKDFNRVLVTETTPYETPIISSNDGFYKNVRNHSALQGFSNVVFKRVILGDRKKNKYTIPYTYKIKKNETEFRRLSIPHPFSQIEMRDFYMHYSAMIVHFCSQSGFSIRAPKKVASTYYFKNLLEDRNLYKKGVVDTESGEVYSKHASSYFSYVGYDRLYKFFTSLNFLKLEKRFSFLQTLDVSKCFDSIYTHSISWATKDKLFTKRMLANKSLNFGDAFDRLMQRSNFNETHGLIIGPEISRIFSEVIFQKIDFLVQKKLLEQKNGLRNGHDYEIRRYVDDVFIFTNSEVIAKDIYKIYSDGLAEYNMHVNLGKVELKVKPFSTAKSKVIHLVNNSFNSFIDIFLEKNSSIHLNPKSIFKKNNLAMRFINEIKTICSSEKAAYNDVSSYIVSAIFERIKRLSPEAGKYDRGDMYSAVYILLFICFFFFRVSPSVNSSYKLASTLIVAIRFVKKIIPEFSDAIEFYIYSEIFDYLSDLSKESISINRVVNLEAYNIMCVIGELDKSRFLPSNLLGEIFKGVDSYYDIISLLFMIGDNVAYNKIKDDLIEKINCKLIDGNAIQECSERALLFLDVMSCPYIDIKYKRVWVRNIAKELQEASPTNAEIDVYIQHETSNPWFVDWLNVDLLNLLEKKQLKKSY
jgi:hypothetical protein